MSVEIIQVQADSGELSVDVVVAGSGAGGAAVAGELRRNGLSVVIVEAGPLLGDIPGGHVRNAFPAEEQLETHYGPAVLTQLPPHARAGEPLPGLPGAKGAHSVGGMLAYWSHMCATPHLELEADPAVPAADWPGLLERAHDLLGSSFEVEGSSERQRRLTARLAAAFPDLPPGRGVQQLPLAGRRLESGAVAFSGADTLLDARTSAAPGTVRILPDHVVRRVLHDGGRARGLEAISPDGKPVRIAAGVVVVAAGAIGTPQLLVASEVDAGSALGAYLTDHVMIVSRVALKSELIAGVPADDPTFSVWIPLSEARPFHAQVLRGWVSLSPFLEGVPANLTTDIAHFVGIDPVPENRLSFDRTRRDGFGLPAVSGRLELGAGDRARVSAALADHYEVASTIGEMAFGLTPAILPPGGSFHLMGTYRPGVADDGTSVVDGHCRVWGYENLYLAGNGLLGRRNSCNPTVTTVALGLRCADAIVGAASSGRPQIDPRLPSRARQAQQGGVNAQ